MGKDDRKRLVGILFLIAAVIIVIVAVLVFLLKGDTTGDVTVVSGGSMVGLKCADANLTHPVFVDYQPISHTNTITANFIDDKLSSITYQYDGVYQSEYIATSARNSAEADYNLILTNKYDIKADIFSHVFILDGANLALTITGDADKVTSRIAPYFLLDAVNDFPKTLKELQAAYEAKGLSCVVVNNDK